MATFNQSGQKVTNQTNIAGNQYNAGRDNTQGDKVVGDKNISIVIVKELEALVKQVQEAAQIGDLDADTAADAEYSLKKATIEAGKDKADKSKCLEYLDKTKTFLDKVVGVSKSAAALGTSLAAAYTKIQGWW